MEKEQKQELGYLYTHSCIPLYCRLVRFVSWSSYYCWLCKLHYKMFNDVRCDVGRHVLCVYVCMHVVSACIHIHVHVCVCMYVCVTVCVWLYVCVTVCVCVCVCHACMQDRREATSCAAHQQPTVNPMKPLIDCKRKTKNTAGSGEAVAEGGGGTEVGGARIVMMVHWWNIENADLQNQFILTGKIRYWILKMRTHSLIHLHATLTHTQTNIFPPSLILSLSLSAIPPSLSHTHMRSQAHTQTHIHAQTATYNSLTPDIRSTLNVS